MARCRYEFQTATHRVSYCSWPDKEGPEKVKSRLMTMSSLYPCGKPCSRGTHYETVKNPALSPSFDHDSIDRISVERLPQLCSTPRKENPIKTTLSRRLIDESWYKSEEGSSVYLVSAK